MGMMRGVVAGGGSSLAARLSAFVAAEYGVEVAGRWWKKLAGKKAGKAGAEGGGGAFEVEVLRSTLGEVLAVEALIDRRAERQ